MARNGMDETSQLVKVSCTRADDLGAVGDRGVKRED